MERVVNKQGKSFHKFLLLWSGEFISAIGSGLTSFGLGIYVFQQTGKASAMALVTLFAFLPSLLLSPVAGVLADRYDRRLLMMVGDSLSALGLVFILFCMFFGEATLWQICLGVTISSVFSSLLEPAYRATITDLLTKEQYTKASGLVQVAGSSKFLISPIIAGFLLTMFDIKLLLMIDICTFFVTVSSTLVVRKGIASKENVEIKSTSEPTATSESTSTSKSISKFHTTTSSFAGEFKEGWIAVSGNKGVLVLLIMTSVLTFFMGFIQLLSTPMMLAFTDSSGLGTAETIAASGMLVSSVLIGFLPIKKGYVKILSGSLFLAGIGMTFFGLRENLVLICLSGFLFFAMLPFANMSLDYLIRTNIDNSLQGRAWGFIGIISQLGYVASFVMSGVLADYVFTPLLVEGGSLADSVGKITGTGSGRGTGFLIILAGLLLAVNAVVLYSVRSVHNLEKNHVNSEIEQECREVICITE